MNTRVVIVGAGPAGTRAAQRLVAAGITPTIIDEQPRGGGQIYRRPLHGVDRAYAEVYGTEHAKARSVHEASDALRNTCRYFSSTTVWAIRFGELCIEPDGIGGRVPFDRLILASGAAERIIPLPGWTLPGCFTLGGAQIALKTQGCAVGARTAFVGTGPLLYLVALQYARAGADVAAVFDTSAFGLRVRAAADMMAVPSALWKGISMTWQLRVRHRVPVHTGITPLRIHGNEAVDGFSYADGKGREVRVQCSAVGLGYDLRSESQLADLAGCDFEFDDSSRNWRVRSDPMGRSSVPNVYLAGDGARIGGADAAEIAGELAAAAVCADLGQPQEPTRVQLLLKQAAAFTVFRRGIEAAFPPPVHQLTSLPDDAVLCRCEGVTVKAFRDMVQFTGAAEINRAKSMTRCGMGRCQGRYCEFGASELLAAMRGMDRRSVGRLRAQAPVKPIAVEDESGVEVEKQ